MRGFWQNRKEGGLLKKEELLENLVFIIILIVFILAYMGIMISLAD